MIRFSMIYHFNWKTKMQNLITKKPYWNSNKLLSSLLLSNNLKKNVVAILFFAVIAGITILFTWADAFNRFFMHTFSFTRRSCSFLKYETAFVSWSLLSFNSLKLSWMLFIFDLSCNMLLRQSKRFSVKFVVFDVGISTWFSNVFNVTATGSITFRYSSKINQSLLLNVWNQTDETSFLKRTIKVFIFGLKSLLHDFLIASYFEFHLVSHGIEKTRLISSK